MTGRRVRALGVVAIGMGLSLSLSACGGSDGLAQATEACNKALQLADTAGSFPDMVENVNASAGLAAKAAAGDEKWDGLSLAMSDYASNLQASQKMAERGAEEASLSEMSRQLEDMIDAKREVFAQCQKVLGAGGEVDSDLLNNFIR